MNEKLLPEVALANLVTVEDPRRAMPVFTNGSFRQVCQAGRTDHGTGSFRF